MQNTRSFFRRGAMCLIWLTASASLALAQGTPPAPSDGPAITSGRSWYFEVLVVLVMFSVALYAVCRSSRRN
ncbi:MAG: hypothetical protein KDA52_08525 [Planctomycetaceae bacterium]|nr:hypothetical protein [Planctomycetaceae bacterium]